MRCVGETFTEVEWINDPKQMVCDWKSSCIFWNHLKVNSWFSHVEAINQTVVLWGFSISSLAQYRVILHWKHVVVLETLSPLKGNSEKPSSHLSSVLQYNFFTFPKSTGLCYNDRKWDCLELFCRALDDSVRWNTAMKTRKASLSWHFPLRVLKSPVEKLISSKNILATSVWISEGQGPRRWCASLR